MQITADLIRPNSCGTPERLSPKHCLNLLGAALLLDCLFYIFGYRLYVLLQVLLVQVCLVALRETAIREAYHIGLQLAAHRRQEIKLVGQVDSRSVHVLNDSFAATLSVWVNRIAFVLYAVSSQRVPIRRFYSLLPHVDSYFTFTVLVENLCFFGHIGTWIDHVYRLLGNLLHPLRLVKYPVLFTVEEE